MSQRIISVSAAPYDGHSVPAMLQSIAACGASHVEPAFIVGYTEPFDESSFSATNIRQWQSWLASSGIACDAFSSHIDLGRDDAVDVFLGRMDFARALGARIINTNAASRSLETRFFKNIEILARHAEDIGLLIGLENPGDGSDNLLNTAIDGPGLLEKINHPRVALNYDAGNTISHRQDTDLAADALLAMPLCKHTHIKDVVKRSEGYFFTPLGKGDVGCAKILAGLAKTDINLSIEIPLRLYRGPNAQPVRSASAIALDLIEEHIKSALGFVNTHLKSIH